MGGSQVLEPGSVFGDYEIDSQVGRGSNAVVYLARNLRHDTWHALKLLRNLDSRRQIRLEQEGIFREELRHPNIVPVTEIVQVGGEPGLVMEFVEGPSLSVWMRDASPPLADCLAVFRGILDGVSHAHRNNVIHRDLKPSNVLLHPGSDQTWMPRISDFGLAKAMSSEVGKFGGLTTVNTGLGTPGYAAPEQVRDASAVTARADFYSLGCILYEMTCGVGPFSGLSAFDTLAAQRDDRFAPPEDLAPGLPPRLYQLIRRLISADPLRRPADCVPIMEEIDHIYEEITRPAPGMEPAPPEEEPAPLPPYEEVSLRLGSILLLCAIPLVALVLGWAVVRPGGL